MLQRRKRICRVLLAEDNPNDVAIVERVVSKNNGRFQLQVATDGMQALDFLRRQGHWANAWMPDLVVLSINMPRISGWGVLATMKADPALRHLPVVIWSASERHEDVGKSVSAGCSGMFTKPSNPRDAEEQIGSILEFYWWAWSHPHAWTAECLPRGRSRTTSRGAVSSADRLTSRAGRTGKPSVFEEKERICRVLLAEDNPKDIAAFRQAAERNEHRFELEVVEDGEAALDFLHRRGRWTNVWVPDFVVLNINMPKLNGWEVLKHMKADPELRLLRVAMWSIAPPDYGDYAARSFELGCSGGFSKPVEAERMESQVKTMLDFYWWAWSHPRAVAPDSSLCGTHQWRLAI